LIPKGYFTQLLPCQLPCLDEDLNSTKIWEIFQKTWEGCSKHKKWAIHLTIFKALKTQMILPIFPKILEIALNLAQPFLILGILNFLQDTSADVSTGYALFLGFGLTYTLSALFNTWFQQLDIRYNTQLRTGIISLIYATSLTRKHTEVGQVITLLNVDITKITIALKIVHDLWSALVITVVGFYILYTQIGIVFLVPFGIIIIMVGLSTLLGGRIADRSKIANQASSTRISAVAPIPTNMKNIRMLGLEQTIEERQSLLRDDEVNKTR
jgi:ATP-binding cassette, subfamily C (CFTR/MRP), member 1